MRTRKKMPTLLSALFGAALLLGAGTTAHALSITYSDATGCGGSTCFGSVYSLDVQSGGGNLYNVTYTVNTSGYTGPGSGLDAIAFKITDNTSNILSTSIISQPATFSDPLLWADYRPVDVRQGLRVLSAASPRTLVGLQFRMAPIHFSMG